MCARAFPYPREKSVERPPTCSSCHDYMVPIFFAKRRREFEVGLPEMVDEDSNHQLDLLLPSADTHDQ
jgi:hypothetical protein